jgi:DNA-directed RNA polymerase subunit M/transcription elongation factor TFIIS
MIELKTLSSQNMIDMIIMKAKKLKLSNLNLNSKEYNNRYNFVTQNSKDIKIDLMKKAELVIDRKKAVKKLEEYLEWHIAYEIEKGIFEFALIKTVIDKLQYNFVENIYWSKLQDICENVDANNTKINNKTILPMIMNKDFRPFFVAFLSPNQLHPQRWAEMAEKLRVKEETINNVATTDLYKCKKCNERKFRIYELQMRGADEPTSKICTCTVCHNTFIL